MSEFSEYGGSPGVVQPDIGDEGLPDEAAAGGLGHPSTEGRSVDRQGVDDAAMIYRRAALQEANGVMAETIIDPDTGVATFVHYDEERARRDYVDGKNYPRT